MTLQVRLFHDGKNMKVVVMNNFGGTFMGTNNLKKHLIKTYHY